MMRISLFLGLLLLAACGADGPPETPGMAVTGKAYIGVVGK